MRQREQIINNIENLEGFLKTLENKVKTGAPINEFLDFLSRSKDTLEEVKAMIEREEISPSELNRI